MRKAALILAMSAALLLSCSKPEAAVIPDEEPGELFEGGTIVLPQEAGGSVTITLEFDAGWQLGTNDNSWLRVSPSGGEAGTVELTLTAAESNDSLLERTGTFRIRTDNNRLTYYNVMQSAAKGAEFDSELYASANSASSLVIRVRANADFSVASDCSWVSVDETPRSVEDIYLEDGTTLSGLKLYELSLSTEANEAEDMRDATLSLSCAGKTAGAVLRQLGCGLTGLSDWNSPFLRRTLAMRFTATWCGNCPYMSHQYELAMEEHPRLIVPFNIHEPGSDLYSQHSALFVARYSVQGYPTGVVNSLAVLSNVGGNVVSAQLGALALEAQSELPAKTAVAAQNVLAGRQLAMNVSVAVKEAGDYTLHAYLMEDGVVYNQVSTVGGISGVDYVHNAIERYALIGEGTDGLDFSADAGEVYVRNVRFTVPDGEIVNPDNCHIVVFVTRSVSPRFTGSVSGVQYGNFGPVVDNVVKLPLNSSVGIDYAD